MQKNQKNSKTGHNLKNKIKKNIKLGIDITSIYM